MLGVVYVRDGHVVAARTWPQRTALARRDLVTAFLSQFYLRGKIVPAEILVEDEPHDREGLEEMLAGLRDGPVEVRCPRRGPGRRLIEMAAENAALALEEHSARAREAREGLKALAALLGLPRPPERIEGYDLSHLAGSEPVAAMAVLVSGVPETGAYRHFQVRAPGGDDVAGMAEVVARRFEGGEGLGDPPDLLLIDGGPTQLAAARRALETHGVAVPAVALAKARRETGVPERLLVPGRDEPLVLAEDDPVLRLLVKARDEAHRFAGRYQRKRRQIALGQGALDGIAGVGPARKQMLVKRFGSVAGIRAAPFEDLAAMPGIGERRARLIRERLAQA
jgi:excinuclease ABC subunit C